MFLDICLLVWTIIEISFWFLINRNFPCVYFLFFFSLFFISACLFVIVFVWLGWCLPPKKRNLDLSFNLCSLNDSLCPGKQNETFNKNKVGGPNTSQRFLFKAACIHPEKQCKTNAEIGYERWPVSFPGHRLPFRFGFQVSLRSTPPSPSTYQTHSLFHTNPFFPSLITTSLLKTRHLYSLKPNYD